MLEREHRLTPMKTVTNAVDVFINPKSRVTGSSPSPSPHLLYETRLTQGGCAGQIIENCGLKNVFRAIPTYMDEAARLNMNEFHPSDQIDRALSVEGAGLEVVA